MLMKKLTLFLLLVSYFSVQMVAQPWMKNVKKPNPGFYEIQNAFKEYEKSSDALNKVMKKYKRWEWYYESRVNSKGKIPAEDYWKSYKRVLDDKKRSKSPANWEPLGPFDIPTYVQYGYRLGNGRVNCVEFHPTDPNTYWIGTPSGGLWKTTNNGMTWTTTTDDLPSIGISDIIVNPDNVDELYIATGDRDASDLFSIGVLKSTDGGETWDLTGLSYELADITNVNELAMDPSNSQVLIAATSAGMYKSTDAGVTWQLKSAVDNFKDLIIKYDDFNVMYASTYFRGGDRIKVYQSTDGGNSWEIHSQLSGMLYNAERLGFGTSPVNPDVIYAVAVKSGYSTMQGIYKTTDGGVNWTKISDNSTPDLVAYLYDGMTNYGQGFYNITVEVAPDDANEVLVGATHMWRTYDGGDTWTQIQEYLPSPTWIHVDFHEFRYNPLNDRLYSANDGGMYYSDDKGTSWTDISAGLQILQSYRMDVSQTTEDMVFVGNQDNGSMRLQAGVVNGILGGDGAECIVNYESDNVVYATYTNGQLFRSANSGNSFSPITPANQTGNWLTPFELSPIDPDVIYAGYKALWRSEDQGIGDSWVKVSPDFVTNLHRISASHLNEDVIYVCTQQQIMKTTNGGENWQLISLGLPPGFISDIMVSPVDDNVLWATMGRYDASQKVYVTRDGGLSWDNISFNLPNVPVNVLVYDQKTSDGIYIGTDVGVYYTNNSMSEWVYYSDNLPNTIVADMAVQEQFNSLVVGTYGRGIWKSQKYYTNEDPVANFSYNNDLDCGGVISFLNKSSGYMDEISWDFGDGNTSDKLNPTHIYSAAGTYEVVLTVTTNGVSSEFSETISFENYNEMPVVDDVTQCGAGSVTLTAQGDNTIFWYDDYYETEPIAQGESYTTPDLSSSKTYFVASGTDESCISAMVPVQVTIHVKPLAFFLYTMQDELTATFNNLSQNATIYFWNFGDGNSSMEVNPTHQYDVGGDYEISLSASNENCYDVMSKSISMVSIEDVNNLKNLTIYPNPSSGQFTVTYQMRSTADFSVDIVDLSGKQVYTREFSSISEPGQFDVDLKNQMKGFYIVKVHVGNETVTRKLLIE
jgi:photosystem II stability/assembly factor-like uncharacterized protein